MPSSMYLCFEIDLCFQAAEVLGFSSGGHVTSLRCVTSPAGKSNAWLMFLASPKKTNWESPILNGVTLG